MAQVVTPLTTTFKQSIPVDFSRKIVAEASGSRVKEDLRHVA